MLMRTLLSFLFISLLCLACGNSQSSSPAQEADASPGHCMERIIALDDSLGTVRNHACERISLSETIRNYVADIRALDFSSCPADFTKAFEEHVLAWEEMIVVTDEYPDLRGEMHDLFDDIKEGEHEYYLNKHLDAIWGTWAEVEDALGVVRQERH